MRSERYANILVERRGAVGIVTLNRPQALNALVTEVGAAFDDLGYFQHRWAVYGREGEPCPGCTCAEGGAALPRPGARPFSAGRSSGS
jgi:hypothetical protein